MSLLQVCSSDHNPAFKIPQTAANRGTGVPGRNLPSDSKKRRPTSRSQLCFQLCSEKMFVSFSLGLLSGRQTAGKVHRFCARTDSLGLCWRRHLKNDTQSSHFAFYCYLAIHHTRKALKARPVLPGFRIHDVPRWRFLKSDHKGREMISEHISEKGLTPEPGPVLKVTLKRSDLSEH
ncbi:hypothetical protein KIL84_020862 [Mauremys mutica]|uniref:Uncharacterized protein n=1 Tax=Mauremys mutica TaxID=74926 RepID=A0A9D4AZE7_9SAUR|nr:hypothetical protein KIL84_020862 [Mauremys mutica]